MSHRTRERPAECLASLPLNYDRSAARSTRELVQFANVLQVIKPLFCCSGPRERGKRQSRCILESAFLWAGLDAPEYFTPRLAGADG
ncbi:hypothetical protein EVAR_49841_1 [Eumeta japonica]|uniref:Uncharacterized protein n=1 Tax=Eumeta variegata TaxID=151549 RepID=A0A4C1Z258_EUMVA|nr:hypothetical protein EVAR_49841_1 [Eumeta japonica]